MALIFTQRTHYSHNFNALGTCSLPASEALKLRSPIQMLIIATNPTSLSSYLQNAWKNILTLLRLFVDNFDTN